MQYLWAGHNVTDSAKCSKIVTDFSNFTHAIGVFPWMRETTGCEEEMGKAHQPLSKYPFSGPGTTSDLFLLFVYAKGVTSWPWIEVREEEEVRGKKCAFSPEKCMEGIPKFF